jgi:gamma-glutamyltranspeptidase/glutathione hydrolase
MMRLVPLAILFAILVCTIVGCVVLRPKGEVPTIPPTPEVISRTGMIVCAHPSAAEIGLQVMKDGGNAVDAAVAALLALNVVEPYASGLGGGGFLGIQMAGEKPVFLNFRERSAMDVDSSQYYIPSDSDRVAMQAGATAICVPGTPQMYSTVLQRFGTKDLRSLIDPAINLAHGSTVSEGMSAMITDYFEDILHDSTMASVFLRDSLPLQPNDILKQPSLANTFARMRDHGFDHFYDSIFCRGMVDYLEDQGSALTTQDFVDYTTKWTEPLHGTYRGYEIETAPPPTAGGVSLIEILNILENFDLTRYKHGSPELILLMAEAQKQGYSDFQKWVADPEFADIPLDTLLSKEYAAQKAAEIPKKKARVLVQAYEPPAVDHGNTTHLVAIDAQGNIVTVTQSINYFFGSGVMVPGYGIIMNNEMADFTWESGNSNSIEGGKQPRSNMCPTIVYKNGKPFLVIGTPGGGRITAAMVEILVNVIDFNMGITEAIDAPRFFAVREHLVMENRFPNRELKKLRKMGYILHMASPLNNYFGGAHAILIDPVDGSYHGAADPRRGGKAMGY